MVNVQNFHFLRIILLTAVKWSTLGNWAKLIRYESLPPPLGIPNRTLPHPALRLQALPMLPYQSDSLAPQTVVSANYSHPSDMCCFTVSSPAAVDPHFSPASQLWNKTRFMVNLSGAGKSQISCKYPPTVDSWVFGAIAVQNADAKSAREVGGPTTGSGGMQSGRSGPWLISPGKTFSIICVMLNVEQKHDPLPRVARSDR